MRFDRLAGFLAALVCYSAVAASAWAVERNVYVPKSTSPHHKYYVRLTEDRSLKGGEEDDVSPVVEIVAKAQRKVAASFDFGADPYSDQQPVRRKMDVYWSADDRAVAFIFHERHYSFLEVYRVEEGSTGAFEKITLPDTAAVIATLIPNFREFRSRWHYGFDRWLGHNIIEFSAGSGALMKPTEQNSDPNIYAWYRFTVDIRDPEAPLIKKVVWSDAR